MIQIQVQVLAYFLISSVPIFDSLRLKIIHDLLIDHNLTLSNINGLFEKFEFVNQKTSHHRHQQ